MFVFLVALVLNSCSVLAKGILDPKLFPLLVSNHRNLPRSIVDGVGNLGVGRDHRERHDSFLQISAGFSNPSNPYCRVCINIFNTLVAKPEFTPVKLCQQQPLNAQRQCELIAASMKRSKTVAPLLEGCTDTTGNFQPELQSDNKPVITESNGVRAAPCPGVIACNIIEAHSGAPMCGYKLRAWGDFYYEKGGVGNPIRPSMLDTWPADGYTTEDGAVAPIMYAPPPWSRISGPNIDCDLCIDTYQMMALNYPMPGETAARRRRLLALEGESAEPPTKTVLCMNQPISMMDRCKKFASVFGKNVDAIKLLVDGCVDKTTLVVTETEKGACSAEVACNVIRAPNGGPFCGGQLRQYGDLTGQPPQHNYNLRAQPLE